MTVLSASSIAARCSMIDQDPMVHPFCGDKTLHHGMSYGLSSAGYDVRMDTVAKNAARETLNIPVWTLDPGEFVLASTVEQFYIPNDIIAMVHDKSSWARKGIALQNTVIEPGWRGFLTLEITNHSDQTIEIYGGSPVAQIVFHLLDQPTTRAYDGKYQDQAAGPQSVIYET